MGSKAIAFCKHLFSLFARICTDRRRHCLRMTQEQIGRVLVVGAGIGGLNLAQGLKQHGIHFKVFERDSSADCRAQGFRFRLNATGVESLRCCLPQDRWQLFARLFPLTVPGVAKIDAVHVGYALSDGTFEPPAISNPGDNLYTVDRTLFRTFLADGLDGDIQYGKRLDYYTIIPAGVKAHFCDGTTEQGLLLIGADGIHSNVARQMLPTHNLVDNDGRYITGKTLITPELQARVPKKAMQCMTVFADPTSSVAEAPLTLITEPVRFINDVEGHTSKLSVQDYMYWVLLSRSATFARHNNAFERLPNTEVADLSLRVTSHWDTAVTSILEFQSREDARAFQVLSYEPEIPSWPSSTHVTLLGDAVHAMSPTSGNGSNLALRDGAALLRQIVEVGISASAVGNYEQEMREVVRPVIESSFLESQRAFNHRAWQDSKAGYYV